MTYIVLDMEWSQPVTKERAVRRGKLSLPVEIIQIGAAAVKDGRVLPSVFNEYVRPVYYVKLRSRIRRLTGITPQILKDADDFERVLTRFRRWMRSLDDETVIVIWGNEDVQLLKAQCAFFGYDDKWIPEWFNLQPIVTRKYNIDRPQMTLAGAVELIGEGNGGLRYHSAANDAYYTALVLSRVDNIPDRVKWQRRVDYVRRNPIKTLQTVYNGRRRYRSRREALRSGAANSYSCPVCGRQYGLRGSALKLSDDEYLSVRRCEGHIISVKLRLNTPDGGGYTVTRTAELCDERAFRLYDEERRKTAVWSKDE